MLAPPGPEPRNRRKPDGTRNHQPERNGRAEPGSAETGPPGTARSTNQSTPPIGQGRKFLLSPAAPKPQHKNAKHQPNTDRTLIRTRNRQKTTAQKPNTSHNAFRQKVNRTRTELDKGPKSSPTVDLTESQKSSETGTQKATPQISQSRKKVLSPAPPKRHHRNAKSQVRRDQEPGARSPQNQKPPKRPKQAKNATFRNHGHKPKKRPKNERRTCLATRQGSTGVAPEFSTFPQTKPKKAKKTPKKYRQKRQGVRE